MHKREFGKKYLPGFTQATKKCVMKTKQEKNNSHLRYFKEFISRMQKTCVMYKFRLAMLDTLKVLFV